MKTRTILTLLFCLFAVALIAQDPVPDKGSGILYFSGKPASTPIESISSEYAYDMNTGKVYTWSRDSSDWYPYPDITHSFAAPSGDPGTDSKLHIDRTNGNLYQWDGDSWEQIISATTLNNNLVWNSSAKYTKNNVINYLGDQYKLTSDSSISERPDTSSNWIVITTENPASTTYVDRVDRLKTSFKSSIENPKYSTNDIIHLRDNNAEFQILRSLSSNEVVDSIFITEVYDTSLTSENLFLLSEDFPRPYPYPWRPSGSGTDIAFEKDVMLSPLGTFTADRATKTVSSLVRQYMQDTIFANTTYYLSFWFRAGDGMPTSGVEMDEIRFLNNGSNYTDPVTIDLITSDTLWRYYEIAMEQSDIDLLPTGATGADWGCRFDGMTNPSEFSVWGMSLSRNPSEQYIRTTDTKTAKRYRGFSKLLTPSQILELDKLPEYIGITDTQILQNDSERLQAAYDYCADGNCDYIDIGRGLTVTSPISIRDGITLISKWSGDIELDDQDPRIRIDLNDSLATAFTAIPDSGNPIPLGASFKNIYFEVVSPVNTVIDMTSTYNGNIDNVLIQANKLAKTGLKYGRAEYLSGQRYGAVSNTNRMVRIFQATEQALMLDSIGALNFFYESQFHRSKIGINAENSNLNCYGCHIEKSDSLAMVFNGGLLYWYGGYTESPNYDPGLGGTEVGDTIAYHIKKAIVAEFKNSTFSTSSETRVYFDVDSEVDEFVLDHNYFSGGTLDRFIDIDSPPTRFENNGNQFFAPGVMTNTIPGNKTSDIEIVYPDLVEGISDRTTHENTILKDSVAFSNTILRSKVNHVAHSEEISSNSTYTYNPSRITIVANDTINPIDSALTAEKITLTADPAAKLLVITPTGLSLQTYTKYNLSFLVHPGTEAFNDNLIITLAGADELIQADTLRSFDASLKEWQRIDTVLVFTEPPTSNQVSIRFYGDTNDYFWLTGVQITQGESVVDYVKTTGSPASGEIKTTIGGGTETWNIYGGINASSIAALNYEGVQDTDVIVTYSPSAYTNSGNDLNGHLDGIDSELSFIEAAIPDNITDLTISSTVDFDDNRITGVPNAEVSSDAVNKGQLDSLGAIISSYELAVVAPSDGDTIVLSKQETLIVSDGLGSDVTVYLDGSAVDNGAKVFIKYGNTSTGFTVDRDDDNDAGNFIGETTTTGSNNLSGSGAGTMFLLKQGTTWYQIH